MLRCVALLSLCIAATARAQTFYEPLEYEYRAGGTLYYYSGVNPLVHEVAAELPADGAAWGRHDGFAFASASVGTSREVETERIRVFSDAWRYGLQDASVVGMTVADVRNQAFASVPRYFEKAQLLRDCPQIDGVRIVPPRAGGITIRKSSGQTIAAVAKPLMIIPKPTLPKPRSAIARSSVD